MLMATLVYRMTNSKSSALLGLLALNNFVYCAVFLCVCSLSICLSIYLSIYISIPVSIQEPLFIYHGTMSRRACFWLEAPIFFTAMMDSMLMIGANVDRFLAYTTPVRCVPFIWAGRGAPPHFVWILIAHTGTNTGGLDPIYAC